MADNHTRIIVSAKDEASKVFQRAGMEAEGLSRRVSHLSGVMGGLAALGGISAVGLSVSEAMGQFGQFETALTDMSKVTNRDLGEIRGEIESINPALGSSTELMRGYYQVISAGVTDPKKSLDLLTVASRASQAAHVSQSETIKALTKVMAGFGDELGNATEASDLLFAMERQGQTSFQELVPVIGDLANLSHEASVSTSALGGAMALLTQTSGSTAEAATKYKALLIGMVKPTTDMAEAFEALGYKSGNALIEDKGLVESLRMLKEYADKSGVSMTSLFGSAEAFMGVSALLANGGKTFADNIRDMGKAAGSTEKAFKKWGKTRDAVQKKFGNVSNNVLMTFGGAFAPEFTEGLDSVSDWVAGHGDEIQDWAKSTGEAVASASDTIATEFSILKSGYDALPEWMQGAGLLGAFLFGKKGLVMLTAATHLAGTFSNMGQGYEAYANGELSFSDFATMNSGELSDFLKNRNPLDSLNAELKALESKQAGYVYQDEKDSFNGEIAEIKKQIVEEYSKAAKKIDSSGDAAALARAAGITPGDIKPKPFVSESNTIPVGAGSGGGKAKEDKKALWQDEDDLAKRRIANSKKISDAWAKRSGRDVQSELKQFEASEKEKLRITKDFNQDYAELTGNSYEFEKTAIKAQVKAWEKAGVDKIQLANWELISLEKLEKEHTADVKAENKKRIADAKKTAREELLARNNFFEGMKAGFQDVLDAEKNWAERGIDIANSFSTSSKAALGDLGFDAMMGQMKSFSDYWSTFWGGLARSISNHLADLAVNKGLDMLMSMGGGLFDMAGSFLSNVWHTGNMRLGADEVASILQEGEMVIPARQAEVIRQSVGSDGMSKGAFFDSVVDRVSVGSSSIFDTINNSQRDVYGKHMLNSALMATGTGLFNGYSNWQTVGQQGKALQDAGLPVTQSAIDNLKWSSALGGLASSFFPSFAGNMFSSFGNQALGMNDDAYSIAGIDFSSSTVGNAIGAVVGAVLGGPVGSVVSGAMSPVFSLAVSGITDLLGLRREETLRDSVEDKFGEITGRLAFQSFGKQYASVPSLAGYYQEKFDLQSPEHKAMLASINPVTYPEQIVLEKINAKIEELKAANAAGAPELAFTSYHNFGTAYRDAAWEKGGIDKVNAAEAIARDMGFASYESREMAAKALGRGLTYEDYYYTPLGTRVDVNSVENPDSALGRAYADAIAAGRIAQGYQFGDGLSGDRGGLGGLGGFGGYTGVGDYGLGSAVDFGNAMQDYADSLGSGGSDRSDRSSGGTGSGNAGGASGSSGIGRRFGGRVDAGGEYVWQEAGLPGEAFFPKTDGFVLSHEDTSQMINALQSIVNAQKSGTSPVAASGGGESTLVLNLHIDGHQIATAIVPALRELSENGVQFVRNDTLIGG
ncbi:phage tail tape measure protein [Maridesulfovibrio ferrireducens]|uniref:phage tail tape measure protein n=1 Tax=Maridesulfovibrio ferrireducens TaxID=246191 RepID=UPI001A1E3B9E|nr:phage tail tape measure protein [Maridesulfovibrio ferrireducens]MBI9110006.1 phage tail tape measure protein [Maridesulfovibrio ferrireducens]